MTRKRLLAAAASLAVLGLGVAPSFAQQTRPACGSGEPIAVNLLSPIQPVTLDGNYDTIVDFQQISRNLYDGLFKLDDAMKLQPSLATGYTQPDDLTYDVTLRQGVTFHDGSAFSADDVVSSVERISRDDKFGSKQRSYLSNVASVSKVGDHEVKFTLKQPDASFLRTLATIIYITPKVAVAKAGDTEFGRHPVGSGPFVFESWAQGDSVVLKANCNYWGDKPIPRRVEFRFLSEPATQISSLESGEIDIATRISPDLANGLKGSSNASIQAVNSDDVIGLSLNTNSGPFADERVRQAFNYAIDKDAITKQLLGGYATPVGQPYAPSILGFSKDVKPYPFDPDRARKLLHEAGQASGLRVEFVNFREELNPVWQSVASYLRDVGVNVTTRFDPNFFVDTWLSKKMSPTQFTFMTNFNIQMDADFMLGLQMDGARRGIYFHTPATDAAIATARGLSDPNKRQAAYDQLNAELHRIAPIVFLYSPSAIYGTSNRIDWKPRPDGAIYLAGVTKKP